MATKKGAPVYSLHPPRMPTLPWLPFHESGVSGGTMRLASALISSIVSCMGVVLSCWF